MREHFKPVFVAERRGPVVSAQDAVTVAEHDFSSCPELDILVVPGGRGTRTEIKNAALLAWVRDVKALHKLSVCTGAALLAVTGLLAGKRATTNKLAFDWVASLTEDAASAPIAPAAVTEQPSGTQWVREARYIDGGDGIWTAAGVSAGMDMALAFIASVRGQAQAEEAARFAEYSGNWQDGADDPWGRRIARH
ncbi:hypothetical protein WJX81_008413 [Elliptochloris bilobata]|uniref:DJ-1/PfpI domain-containing protein n=1 Tax=Elliptochloris bilobata TaxID=381761 RepID=A0AAW1RGM0_9CHLO